MPASRVNPASPILPRSAGWWLCLALILTLVALLYLRGYNTSLPYLAHVDEPAFSLAAKTIIDSGSARSIAFDAYPPGIITLHYLLIKHLTPSDAHFTALLPLLRLMTIAVWMLLTVLIALIGSLLAQPLTGLMAAAIWTVNPWTVERVRFALPDAYLTFFTLLGLWLALVGVLHARRSFSTAAVYSIMLATVFKTQAIFIAPIVILMPLLNLWRQPAARRDAVQQTFWNGFRFAVFLLWLLLLYPTLEADRIPFWVAPPDRLSLPSLTLLWENLAPVLMTFQPIGGWLCIAALSLLLLRHRQRIQPIGILTVGLAALAWLAGMSLFGTQHLRQFFALGALLAILYALGLSGLLFALTAAAQRLALPPRFAPAALSALLALGLLPAFQESDRLAHNFSLPDRRNDLAHYMDTSVEPGMYLSHSGAHKVFNRSWGGYDGVNDFPRYPQNALLPERHIDEWRALGVEYAIMPWHLVHDNPRAFYPAETLQLKAYPPSAAHRGPALVVLRLHPMQHTLDAQLGPIRFSGYDINAPSHSAGDAVIFRLYWQAAAATDAPLQVFNHLLNAAGELVAQVDGIPLWDARRSTMTWDDPAEILLGRNFILQLPSALPPDVYALVSGFYDPQTSARLTAADGSSHIEIAEITVR